MTRIKEPNQVSTLGGIAYSLPVVPILMLLTTHNVLSGLYATHYGLALASISLVMLIGGLFDAVTDPAIGYWSDRYHAKTGSRRPFVVIGGLLLIPCAWFLLNPAEGVTWFYFLVWYLLFYFSMTLFTIPHLTWGGEISPMSEEKAKVYSYRAYASYSGAIIFAVIPLLPFSEGTKITPETMRSLVLVAGVLIIPTLLFMIRYTAGGERAPRKCQIVKIPENPFKALMSLSHNIPALWYIGAFVTHGFAGAFYLGLLFMVIDSYLGLGEYYSYLLLVHLGVAIIFIRPAHWAIVRLGKISALVWSYSMLGGALIFLLLAILNNGYSLLFLVLFNVLGAMASPLANVASYSLLSDIADFGTLKTRVNRSATYFSITMLTGKTCVALGIGASITIASWFGFDPAAEAQVPQAFWGIALAAIIIPFLLNIISIFCILKITITEKRHAIIRRRLDFRVAREANAMAQPPLDQSNNTPRPILCKT